MDTVIRNITLQVIKPLSGTWEDAGKALWSVYSACTNAANIVRTDLLSHDKELFTCGTWKEGKLELPYKIKTRKGEEVKVTQLPKLEDDSKALYRTLCDKFPFISTRIINYVMQDVHSRYVHARFDTAVGRDTIPTYRRYSFQTDQATLRADGKNYVLKISLLSRRNDLGLPCSFEFLLHGFKLAGRYRDALDRLVDGGKLRSIKVIRNDRKNKWMIAIPADLPVEDYEPISGRTMSVFPPGPDKNGNLRFLRCACQVSKKKSRESVWSEDLEFESMVASRKRYEKISKSISKKYRQDTSTAACGHGRKRAIKNKSSIQNKYRRQCKTHNQQRAAHIITLALRWRCDSIEFVSPGDIKDKKYNPLDSWPWYELEQCIKNKCEEHKVAFNKVSGEVETLHQKLVDHFLESHGWGIPKKDAEEAA